MTLKKTGKTKTPLFRFNRRFFWSMFFVVAVVALATIMAVFFKVKADEQAVNVGVPIPGARASSYTFAQYVGAWYYFSLRLGGLLAALMGIYAGYKYVTSAGNDQAVKEAKDILLGALAGVVILYLIPILLRLLGVESFGTDPASNNFNPSTLFGL